MKKQSNNINIVFFDDLDNLTKEQMDLFLETLKNLKESDKEKERKLMQYIKLTNGGNSFSININDNLELSIYGETLLAHLSNEQSLDSDSKEKIKDIVEKYKNKPTLAVVDMCLLEADKNDPTAGPLLWKEIQQNAGKVFDVLFMTGNVNLMNRSDFRAYKWHAYRATINERMNQNYLATTVHEYYPRIKKHLSEDDPMFNLLQYLLASKYRNRQYFGVVLLKAYLMASGKDIDEDDDL